MNCILVLESNNLQEFHPVMQGTTQIGRDSDNDIQILDESLSRHHARINNMENTCDIVDLESTNGTFVNEHRIQTSILRHGDIIRLGDCNLRFEEVQYEVTSDLSSTDRDYSARSNVSTVRVKTVPVNRTVEQKRTTTLSPFKLKPKAE